MAVDEAVPPPELYRLEDLLLRPELLLPPPVVVPRLAWEGRVTLLAAREKVGKSTLMGQAVTALSRAPRAFLGDDIETGGRTLWIGLDEPMPDIVRRLDRYGATGGVDILRERPGVQALYDLIAENETRLVVIDTLLEFVSGFVDDANSPTQIQPILKTLRRTAQDTNVGIVILHHASKGTGDYRDSTQIGAGVDAMVLMKEDEKDAAARICKCKGRVPNADFRMIYMGGVYDIADGELPIALQIQRVVSGHPGCSTRDILKQIGSRTDAVLAALSEIEVAGLVRNGGSEHRHKWFTANGLHSGNTHASNGRP